MITEKDIKATFVKSLNAGGYHHTLYRDIELGIQVEVVTKKTTMKGNSYYFIDGEKGEYKTVEALVTAYNKLFPNGRPQLARKQMRII